MSKKWNKLFWKRKELQEQLKIIKLKEQIKQKGEL